MALFRKKPAKQQIAQLVNNDGDWQVSTGTNDGNPMIIRRRVDLGDAPDRHEWPIRIGIAIPLNNALDTGLPAPEEDQALGSAETTICSAAGDRAVLAVVITTSGMREFVLHARSADWLAAFSEGLQADVSSHQVQVIAHQDANWTVYDSFAS